MSSTNGLDLCNGGLDWRADVPALTSTAPSAGGGEGCNSPSAGAPDGAVVGVGGAGDAWGDNNAEEGGGAAVTGAVAATSSGVGAGIACGTDAACKGAPPERTKTA